MIKGIGIILFANLVYLTGGGILLFIPMERLRVYLIKKYKIKTPTKYIFSMIGMVIYIIYQLIFSKITEMSVGGILFTVFFGMLFYLFFSLNGVTSDEEWEEYFKNNKEESKKSNNIKK